MSIEIKNEFLDYVSKINPFKKTSTYQFENSAAAKAALLSATLKKVRQLTLSGSCFLELTTLDNAVRKAAKIERLILPNVDVINFQQAEFLAEIPSLQALEMHSPAFITEELLIHF